MNRQSLNSLLSMVDSRWSIVDGNSSKFPVPSSESFRVQVQNPIPVLASLSRRVELPKADSPTRLVVQLPLDHSRLTIDDSRLTPHHSRLSSPMGPTELTCRAADGPNASSDQPVSCPLPIVSLLTTHPSRSLTTHPSQLTTHVLISPRDPTTLRDLKQLRTI